MLNFILGRSGYGKSHYVFEKMKGLIADKSARVILIIPEQCSFFTEKEILDRFSGVDAQRIEVYSFTRLAYTVLKNSGNYKGRRLSEVFKTLLMSRAVRGVKDELEIYKKNALRTDFVNEMLSIVSELKASSIKSGTIYSLALPEKLGTLKGKLNDIARIYDKVEGLYADGFVDPDDDLSVAELALDTYHFFDGATVFFDEFSGFTAQEYAIIRQALRQAKEVYFTAGTDTAEETDGGFGLFSTIKDTIARVSLIAEEEGVKQSDTVFLPTDYRHSKNTALKHIDKNIFHPQLESDTNEADRVSIYSADNVYDECEFIAKEIHRLVRTQGLRFRDFAVIVRELDLYDGILDNIFEKYGISFYLDLRDSIESRPLIALVCAVMQIISGGYKSSDILRYIKTGLCGIESGQISAFEDYVLLWNINGADFKSPFTENVNGLYTAETEGTIAALAELNVLRQKIIEPLLRLNESAKYGGGNAISEALYRFLLDIDAYGGLYLFASELTESGEPDMASEQLRTWDILMGILDEMSMGTGNDKVGIKGYYELLSIVLKSFDTGVIPQGLDEVLIGTADRIRPQNPKYVFMLGLNDEKFPKAPVSGGLLSVKERDSLSEFGLSLPNGTAGQTVREQLMAYQAATCSSEGLYLSYTKFGEDGEKLQPSVVVTDVLRMYESLQIKCRNELCDDFETEQEAFEYMAENFSQNNKTVVSLKHYFENHPKWEGRYAVIDTVSQNKGLFFERSENARTLYSEDMRLSATQIDTYHTCKFKYFCSYGLNLRGKKTAEISPLGFGNIIHAIMETGLTQMSEIGFERVTQKDISEISDKALNDYVELFMGGLSNKSKGFQYKLKRIHGTACELLEHIRTEFLQGGFKPVAFELDIGRELEPVRKLLPDGGSFYVVGKVDRVDALESDGKSYLRIVDYKTSKTDFSLYEVLHGLNTQMLIYLDTIIKNGVKFGNKRMPAGILYHIASKPDGSGLRHDDDKKLEDDSFKSMAMKGLLLDDENVIRAMEKEEFSGFYIDEKHFSKGENALSLQHMVQLMNKIESIIGEMAASVKDGKIDAQPVKRKNKSLPCEYCDFRAVCGREDEDPAITLETMKKDDVTRLLEEGGADE